MRTWNVAAAAMPLIAGLAVQESPAPAEAPPSRALLLELTSTQRLAGTSGSRFGADIVARHLRRAGFDVELDERLVLLSLPRRIELALFEDGFATRPFVERVDSFDPDRVPAGDVPPFNAWSPSGDVRAPVVDAGHGLRADYERLADAGVDVAGRVVLVRYGQAYRGVLVELATELGAAAVLLFSDPASDGDLKGPAWPEGPWKPDWEAQRGSIAPVSRAPGDPSTPGWPSPPPGRDARDPAAGKRLEGAELAAHLPRIPCLPIGARDARAILARLATARIAGDASEGAPGASAPSASTGASTGASAATEERPVGPGPVEAHLVLEAPRELRTITNVVGRLAGAGDEVVLAGNHRDAWVRGAHDAGSGTVALLRAAERLGRRAEQGWKPRAAVVLAFWDAEESGLIGSTEWGEANAAWLAERATCYVNADAMVGGVHFRSASGTPGMLGALRRALERVGQADASGSLWDEWTAAAAEKGGEPRLSLPGSGSDFAVFLHHLGLPVIDLGLGGSSGGQYHTAFDDFAIVERFIDPGFAGHEMAGALLAELLGDLADRGREAFDPVEASRELAQRAREAGLEADADGTAWLGAERAERLAAAFERIAASPSAAHAGLYRALALPEGLPGRPWFQNRLWAPGLEDGYASETFPTLRAAARRGAEDLDAEVGRLERAVLLLAPAPDEGGEVRGSH